jgi:hypothetical protein
MTPATTIKTWPMSAVSELIISDRLIALAKDADRAGYTDTAERLITLACSVFDEAPKKPH